MTDKLTVSEEEIQELLANEIELDPPLSEQALEKMEHNRKTEFYHPDMEYLDDEPLASKAYIARQAILEARSRIRKLEIGIFVESDDPDREIEEQLEIAHTALRRHFELLKPLLPYHVFWEDGDFTRPEEQFDILDPDGGLKQLREIDIETLSITEVIAAEQLLSQATHAYGLYVDISDDLAQTRENVRYWADQLPEDS